MSKLKPGSRIKKIALTCDRMDKPRLGDLLVTRTSCVAWSQGKNVLSELDAGEYVIVVGFHHKGSWLSEKKVLCLSSLGPVSMWTANLFPETHK